MRLFYRIAQWLFPPKCVLCRQILVGREETVAVMTENAKKNRRYTGLKLRLQGKVE